MTTLRAALAALLLAGCARHAAPAGDPAGDPPGAPAAGARVVFFDDFGGATLDRSRWTVDVRGEVYNDELQAYVDTLGTVSLVRGADAEGAANGALALTPRHVPAFVAPGGRRVDFISGHVHTRGKMEFAYGTASARMKLPAGAGLWPAFWILGTGDWPATGEIDVMENVGDPTWASVAIHGPGYSGDTPLFNRLYFPAGADATAWHVYAVEWTREALVFRIDGALVYRATRPMIEHYGRWAFDEPKYLILNLALGGAFPLKVNGVRTPYLGLPASTARLIAEGRARVLVDWVRVVRD